MGRVKQFVHRGCGLWFAGVAALLFGHHAVTAQLYNRPFTYPQLRAATVNSVEKGAWRQHLELVDRAMLEFARNSPAAGGAQRYDTIKRPCHTPHDLALAQPGSFIRLSRFL